MWLRKRSTHLMVTVLNLEIGTTYILAYLVESLAIVVTKFKIM